jgi:tRNA (cmo5U34)-methyltransferase
MSVASHLNIELAEYDERIRTFVPRYERMIATVAETLTLLLDTRTPTIVDLGTGTGALAAKCIAALPDAQLIGIDMDPGMLAAARIRLRDQGNVHLEVGSFLDRPLPSCDALVACISLHHIRDAKQKKAFYAACSAALRPGGLLVSADCFMAGDAKLQALQREAWLAHLQRTYSRADAEGYLDAWAGEDTYFPLADELAWLKAAGLAPEVIWSTDGFAVVAARHQG